MKNKYLLFLVVIVIFIFLININIFSSEEESGSKEVVVKGKLKIKIETEKPEIKIKTNINEVAEEVIKTEDTFLSLSPEDVKNVKEALPVYINSERADYHPDISFFETPPIFKIWPRAPKGVEIEKWAFKVTDPRGSIVYKVKGSGNFPEKFVWDGFDRQGKILKVGKPYLYMLTYIDKAGVPGTVMRKKPKIVNAIKYRKGNKLFLEVSHKILFKSKRKERLSDTGFKILKEIEDYIKMINTFPVKIIVFSEDKELAVDQLDTLKRVLIKDLEIPEKFFKLEGYKDKSIPRTYRTIFILES